MKKQTTETDAAAIAGSNMLLPSAFDSATKAVKQFSKACEKYIESEDHKKNGQYT